jgi:fatty-acyl-CoA synthase
MKLGEDVPEAALRDRMAELDPDDDINIQYTSGTTGFPKGVTLSHFNILNNAHHGALNLRLTDQDRLLVPVPFYHCFGMVMSNLACMSVGACAIIAGATFSPRETLETVEKERCTALHGVPTMFIAELSDPEFSRFDLSSLRTGIMAGAPCPMDTMQEVMSKMHMTEVNITYGQTEVAPAATMTMPDDSIEHRVGSVGKVMAWQELKVIDPASGKTVPRHVQGEICFRGYNRMSRYYNNPEATRETIDETGWLHSGDLGTMDDEGYVKITGRIKEMVIRGGENIYPREIEEFLRGMPELLDVYVIGVPDRKFGEELMAWVLPRNGKVLNDAACKEFCKGKIAHYKVPRYWKFVSSTEDFPMTVTGKIQKFKMRELAVAELGI